MDDVERREVRDDGKRHLSLRSTSVPISIYRRMSTNERHCARARIHY